MEVAGERVKRRAGYCERGINAGRSVTGADIDVGELPLCIYHKLDAGKYITAGLSVMRDPETGINNVGIYRHMLHERDLLGIQLSETADGNVILKKYEARNEPCPIQVTATSAIVNSSRLRERIRKNVGRLADHINQRIDTEERPNRNH